MANHKQAWLYNGPLELLLIIAPAFLSVAVLFVLPDSLLHKSINPIWWVFLILFMDVGHVYSTLYKSYFNKVAMAQHRQLFIFIPILCFTLAFLLLQFGVKIFWMGMAYLAVFHFIRQQFGFVKVYQRKNTNKWADKIDIVCVYAATLFPVLYWHLKGPFEYNWFMDDDFLYFTSTNLLSVATIIYYATLLLFAIKLIYDAVQKRFNIAASLIVLGTYVNWYFGIVYFKSDFAFTLTNVAAHGIPYIALVWLASKKDAQDARQTSWFRALFKPVGIIVFIAIPLCLAFLEEGFWDAFIWQEHQSIFKLFEPLQTIELQELKLLLVPLLVTPQLTHYFLDAFIWKVSKGHLPDFGK
jgi:hypothetical protein